jgi:DNA polymerase elongation subunit (family B)
MKLFENISKINYNNYWHRYYNTDTQKTEFEMVQIQDEMYFSTTKKTKYKSFLTNEYLMQETTNASKREVLGKFPKPYKFIKDNYWSQTEHNYNKRVRGFYIDIETRSIGKFPDPIDADQEIVCIQIYDNIDDMYYMIVDKGPSNIFDKEHPEYSNTTWLIEPNEKKRIKLYTDLLKEKLPYFVTAWNGEGFDFLYLYNRMKNLKINVNSLSVLNKTELTEKQYGHQKVYTLKTAGVFYVDLMLIYKKFVLAPRSSYAIDNIAEIEINQKKVNHNEYDKFDDFYLGNYKVPYDPTPEQKNSKIYKIAVQYEKTKDEKYLKLMKQLSWDDFLYYSIKDSEILYKIDKTIGLTPMMISIAEKMGVLFDDTLGTVKPWSTYISNVAFKKGLIVNPKGNPTNETNKGGFVRDSIKGRYKWVVSEDITSMYPLLSMTASNMSPETYISINKLPKDIQEIVVKYFHNEIEDERLELSQDIWDEYTRLLQKYNYSGTITGAVFDNSYVGLLPELVHGIYKERKVQKNEFFEHKRKALDIQRKIDENFDKELQEHYRKEKYLENEKNINQLTSKTLINGVYGATGNKYFPLFNIEMARAITGNGRYFIKLLANNINSFLRSKVKYSHDPVIAGDTDSVYFSLEPMVNVFLKSNPDASTEEITVFCDKFTNKYISPIVQQTITDFATKLNCKNIDVIGCDREVIAERANFHAKKNYIMAVADDEGTKYYDNPKIKMTGVELKKSSIPEFVKEKFQDVIDILLYQENSDIVQFIKESKKEMYDTKVYKLAKTTSVTSLDYSLGQKGIPINSRASLIYNKYIEDNNLTDIYEKIQPSDKIKLIYLDEKNPTLSNIIAFKDPRFIELFKDYISYDLIWEKYFESSLENMTIPIGWNLKIGESLDFDEW